jgi:hypothetical protein
MHPGTTMLTDFLDCVEPVMARFLETCDRLRRERRPPLLLALAWAARDLRGTLRRWDCLGIGLRQSGGKVCEQARRLVETLRQVAEVIPGELPDLRRDFETCRSALRHSLAPQHERDLLR